MLGHGERLNRRSDPAAKQGTGRCLGGGDRIDLVASQADRPSVAGTPAARSDRWRLRHRLAPWRAARVRVWPAGPPPRARLISSSCASAASIAVATRGQPVDQAHQFPFRRGERHGPLPVPECLETLGVNASLLFAEVGARGGEAHSDVQQGPGRAAREAASRSSPETAQATRGCDEDARATDGGLPGRGAASSFEGRGRRPGRPCRPGPNLFRSHRPRGFALRAERPASRLAAKSPPLSNRSPAPSVSNGRAPRRDRRPGRARQPAPIH